MLRATSKRLTTLAPQTDSLAAPAAIPRADDLDAMRATLLARLEYAYDAQRYAVERSQGTLERPCIATS